MSKNYDRDCLEKHGIHFVTTEEKIMAAALRNEKKDE